MADQSVRVENMPDSGSRHRVAFDLAKLILNQQSAGGDRATTFTQENVLKVYVACRAEVI